MSVAAFRFRELFRGVKDSAGLWWSLKSSRTLRGAAQRLAPFYVIMISVGLWFYGVDRWWMYQSVSTRTVLYLIYQLCWSLPLYFLGSLLQLRQARIMRQAISNVEQQKHVRAVAQNNKSFTATITETIYGVVLNLMYLCQTYATSWILWLFLPRIIYAPIHVVISTVMLAWATSFSAFECRLITKNQDLFARIWLTETHWSYTLGFGLPLSIAYHVLPEAVAAGVWQFGVLLLMLHSMRLNLLNMKESPSSSSSSRRRAPKYCDFWKQFRERLRVFYFSQYFAINIIQFVTELLEQPEQPEQPEESAEPEVQALFCAKPPELIMISDADCLCPIGWGGILNDFAGKVQQAQAQFAPLPKQATVIFLQIKEKWGSLHIYPGCVDILDEESNIDVYASGMLSSAIQRLAEEASQRASHTCVECGNVDAKMRALPMSSTVLCDACVKIK